MFILISVFSGLYRVTDATEKWRCAVLGQLNLEAEDPGPSHSSRFKFLADKRRLDLNGGARCSHGDSAGAATGETGVGASELEAAAVSRESCARAFYLELRFITLSRVFYGRFQVSPLACFTWSLFQPSAPRLGSGRRTPYVHAGSHTSLHTADAASRFAATL